MQYLFLTLLLAIAASANFLADTTFIRVAHLSPDAPNVDVYVDGKKTLTDVAFGDVSKYLAVPAGPYNLVVTPSGATTPVVINATVPFKPMVPYTVAAEGFLKSIGPVVYTDDVRPKNPVNATVRFIHASPDAPVVNIRVKNGPTLATNLAFKQATEYLVVPPATYPVEIVVASSGAVALEVNAPLTAGARVTAWAVNEVAKLGVKITEDM